MNNTINPAVIDMINPMIIAFFMQNSPPLFDKILLLDG